MRRIVALLLLICLLFTGCELPVFDLRGETTAPTDVTEEIGDPFYDENGNRIGTIIFYRDEIGVVLKEEVHFNDGTFTSREYEYDTDGNMTKCTYQHSDGRAGVESYFTNGGIQSDFTQFDGGTREVTYDEYGTLLTSAIMYDDGASIVNTYYENGRLNTNAYLCAEGTTIVNEFYESGKLKSMFVDGAGGQHELHYGEDGITLDEEYLQDTGIPNSITSVQIDGDTPGVVRKTYDPNGRLYEILREYEDGSYFEERYFENGILEYTKWKKGSDRVEWYYYHDGTVRMFVRIADNVNYSAAFFPNGVFGSQRHLDYDADIMRETEYDMYGIILKTKETALS